MPSELSSPPLHHPISTHHPTSNHRPQPIIQPNSALSSLRAASISALRQLNRSFPSTPPSIRLSLPIHRTSLVDQATSTHSPLQILSIAIRKWFVVFLSVHAVVSSGTLAFALIRRKRAVSRGESRPLSRVLKTVWLDATTARLATCLGSYSALWSLTYPALLKLKLNRLPSTDSAPAHPPRRRHDRLEQFLTDWAAAVAGAVAGLALLAQTKQERVNLAPNIFCRGLYTLLKHRPLIRFPHGDLILFGLSNAQIMSAFVLNPSSLPAWYWHWIRRVGSLDVKFLELHRHLNRGQVPDMALVEQALECTRPRTRSNERRVDRWLSQPDAFSRPCAPCHLNHPLYDNCLVGNGGRTWGAFKSMLPTYAILHLIPSLLFRSKLFMKAPIAFLVSIAKKTASSTLFLASFVWIILHSVCIPSQLYDCSKGRIRLQGTAWNAVIGFSTALSLLWEDPRRRGELALYCAPKALASVWINLKARGLVRSIPLGELALASVGTGMLMHCFVHGPHSMPALIRGTLGQLVDPHWPGRQSLSQASNKVQVVGGGDRTARERQHGEKDVDYLSSVEKVEK